MFPEETNPEFSYLKKNFFFKVTTFEENEEKLKVKSEEIKTISKKELKKEYVDYSFNNKIVIPIEICYAPPKKFKLNTLYIRADGKAVYLFVKEGEDNGTTN